MNSKIEFRAAKGNGAVFCEAVVVGNFSKGGIGIKVPLVSIPDNLESIAGLNVQISRFFRLNLPILLFVSWIHLKFVDRNHATGDDDADSGCFHRCLFVTATNLELVSQIGNEFLGRSGQILHVSNGLPTGLGVIGFLRYLIRILR